MHCFPSRSQRISANRLESIGRRIERLPFSLVRVTGLLVAFGACLCAEAQKATQAGTSTQPTPTHIGQVPRVPGVSTLLRGLNAGITFSGVHDSSIGWYNVVTPALSYTFSSHYSADASLSIYPYRLVQKQTSTGNLRQGLVPNLRDLGDTSIGLHANFNPRIFRNTTTASFTAPTGDRSAGLGTGKVTFDFSNHMERTFKQTGFLVDFGVGNSSGLFNNIVTNDYTSLGPLAHFQEGIIVWLPSHSYIQSVAYEQIPIGNQTLYANPGPPSSPTRTVISGKDIGQDNGITTSLGLPLTEHITLSSYYNRSFRQNLDTVSIGLTYVLHGTPLKRRLSMIDKALREAARTDQ
jgi:hypothetical protein